LLLCGILEKTIWYGKQDKETNGKRFYEIISETIVCLKISHNVVKADRTIRQIGPRRIIRLTCHYIERQVRRRRRTKRCTLVEIST
jgi:hypothetical protein